MLFISIFKMFHYEHVIGIISEKLPKLSFAIDDVELCGAVRCVRCDVVVSVDDASPLGYYRCILKRVYPSIW